MDAGRSVDEVREEVWGVVKRAVEEVEGMEVGRFE